MHFRNLLQPFTALAVLLVISLGCGDKSKAAPSPVDQSDPTVRADQDGQSVIDPEIFTGPPIGVEGMALWAATVYAHAATGGSIGSFEEVRPFVPFVQMIEGWTLVEGHHPTGLSAVLAERRLSLEPWGSLVDSNMSYVPSGYEGWEPPLGVDGESARYLLLQNPAMTDGPILISLSSPECRQFLNGLSQIPGIGLTAEELGPVALRQVPALAGPEETKLGYFASMLNDATRLSLYAASPGVPPGSLEELAEEYGGQTPSAWINPYTGAAMQNVPLDQATPGNYTEFPHADGVLFAIHYRDQENGTSSVIVGQRGQLDPNHGLLEDIQEANEEAGS